VTAEQATTIFFLFAVGACIGSFINVAVWRLPRGESIVTPPSHCPKCDHRLAWRDNLPVVGWIMLAGKCRYCGQKISPRYPIVEFLCGALFALFYAAIFVFHQGPFIAEYWHGSLISLRRMDDIARDWPIFGLYLATIGVLLAVSLIDADFYTIPTYPVWGLAALAILVHTLVDRPDLPGNVLATPGAMALAAGGAVGLLVSIALLELGLLPLSFAEGESALEIDKDRPPEEQQAPEYAPWQIRVEMAKEVLFLLPPFFLAGLSEFLAMNSASVHHFWQWAGGQYWLSGLMGALMGGLAGGLTVWITRILGSFGFGKEAMGLGDIHLMFGIGSVIGAGAAVVTFFLAPFFGIAMAVYLFLARRRRQLPFGPYLSMSAGFVMLFYFPIYDRLRPGLVALRYVLRTLL